ncbi:MAG TPA: alpha/beta hydrolase-fold protein [Terriglobales bacterium]|nr:alpha/beta hydrolase-fold protein [Terriglobales bacterium]
MSKLFIAISFGFLLIGCCVPTPACAQEGSNQLPIRSPRVVALEKQLESGDVAALDSFWSEIKQQGAPLVEPISGDDKHVLVTFLWRGGRETKNVGLFSDLLGAAEAPEKNLLVNLPGTNVWFKTYAVRKGGRFAYYLSPNDSLLPYDQRKGKDWDTLQPDPLNPRHFVTHYEQRDKVSSLVELPGAAPVPAWLGARPDVPSGRTEVQHLSSKILGNERRFWVYTPPGYTADGKPYDLLVLFDGGAYARTIPTATIIENLLAAGRIHPLVVLMVDQKNRNIELTCNEAFNEFLVRELMPWVHEHYHVSSNPAETIVGGFSARGLAAAFAALRHPEIFGNVLSLSGYFSWDPREDQAVDEEDLEWEWIIRQFAASPQLPLRFTLTVGLFERFHREKLPDMPTLLQSNRHMRDVLLAKGYPLNYREVPGGHEVYAFELALPDALMSVVGTRARDK